MNYAWAFIVGFIGGFGMSLAIDVLGTSTAFWLKGVLDRHIERKQKMKENDG